MPRLNLLCEFNSEQITKWYVCFQMLNDIQLYILFVNEFQRNIRDERIFTIVLLFILIITLIY